VLWYINFPITIAWNTSLSDWSGRPWLLSTRKACSRLEQEASRLLTWSIYPWDCCWWRRQELSVCQLAWCQDTVVLVALPFLIVCVIGKRSLVTWYSLTVCCKSAALTMYDAINVIVCVWNVDVCRGLKKPLERLLSGLLETDDRNRWSYEAFFNESLALTSRSPIYVFSLSMASLDRLYVTSPHVTSVLYDWTCCIFTI